MAAECNHNREWEVQKIAGEENVADIPIKKREIRGAREAHGIHQDNKTRDGLRADGCMSRSAARLPAHRRRPVQRRRQWERCATKAVAAKAAAAAAGRPFCIKEALCVQSPRRSTTIKTPSSTDYLRWARQRRRFV